MTMDCKSEARIGMSSGILLIPAAVALFCGALAAAISWSIAWAFGLGVPSRILDLSVVLAILPVAVSSSSRLVGHACRHGLFDDLDRKELPR